VLKERLYKTVKIFHRQVTKVSHSSPSAQTEHSTVHNSTDPALPNEMCNMLDINPLTPSGDTWVQL